MVSETPYMMTAYALDTPNDQHHREEIANCLVDLHGTCIILPFHREGLSYLSLLVIAIIQIVVQCVRITAREINSPNPPNDYSEWHLLFGRFGLLFFTIATALDYIRLALGAWDASWPSYILSASNTTVANELWSHHGYGGAVVQSFLWWYCCFLQLIMLPIALLSVSYLYVKARLRLRLRLHNLRMKHFFFLSGVVVLPLLALGLVAFFLGPVRTPLHIVRVTGLWSMASPSKFMNVVLINLLVWQGALLILATSLWYLEGPSKRLHNTFFLFIVATSFGVSVSIGSSAITFDSHVNSWWLSSLAIKFLVQLTIGAQIWVDITHNPDDYGRLNDDMYRLPTISSSLRQPLLAGERAEMNHDDNQNEEDEDLQDDVHDDNDVDDDFSSAEDDTP